MFALAVLALSAGSAAAAPAPYCTLAKLAELPVTMIGNAPTVPAKINGQDAQFIADSGAFFSSLSWSSLDKFGLRARQPSVGMSGVEGAVGTGLTNAKDFSFGGLPTLHDMYFLVVPLRDPDTAGLLGQNILGFADTEYDLARGVIRLIRPQGCERAVPAYWAGSQPVSVVDFQPTSARAPHIVGTATINGQTVRVLFDTGTPRSILKLRTAERLGFRRDAPNVVAGETQFGIGSGIRGLQSWIAPFDTFEVGGEQIRRTKLLVSDIELPGADMLLGADFFVSHHVYVSQGQHRLYFTYSGGPVFRLDASTAVSVAGEDTAAPKDADGFRRRGAAWMARRDYASAVADLDRAVEMDRSNADGYLLRARVHMAMKARPLAKADLDEALKFRPNDLEALIARGDLELSEGDTAQGVSDLEAAIKVAPKNSGTSLEVAAIYARSKLFKAAISQYDAWLGAHPNDSAVTALNGRCRARALSGQELEPALADCVKADRMVPRTPAILSNKGLVLLRMARFDEAIDAYDAVLKIQPKDADSLYGRGLAKLGKGDPSGRADVELATQLEPDLPKEAARYGITAPSAKPAAP